MSPCSTNASPVTLPFTVKVPRDARRPAREGALRAPLPGPDQSYLIGSDPSCRIRLDHPLVQPRPVAVRRDVAGVLWLEDRGTAAGTYLNGQRLRGRQSAGPGDILQVGPFSARVGTTALELLEQGDRAGALERYRQIYRDYRRRVETLLFDEDH